VVRPDKLYAGWQNDKKRNHLSSRLFSLSCGDYNTMNKILGARLWVISPFLSLVLISTGWSMTLRELIAHSRQIIGDSSYYNPVPKITDARITSYLNEAQHYASAHAWAFVRRTTFTLSGRTTEYTLPNDFLTTQRVTLDDVILNEATLPGLDGDGINWLSQSGKPSSYYIRTTTVSLIGFNPTPTETSTGSITLDYYTQLDDLVSQTDVPFNGQPDFYPLHETLAKFVAYRFFLSVGNMQLSDVYAKEFVTDISRLKEIPTIKPNYRPGFRADPR